MTQQAAAPLPIVSAEPRRTTHGSEGAFEGSKWNLFLEWRLLHSRDLTQRGSALLDAVARETLGYRTSRQEIGRKRLMKWCGIKDGRDFNRVRDELKALGLGVTHTGTGINTRTTYDVGPLLQEALDARERRPSSRQSGCGNDGSTAVLTTAHQPSTTTAPETPRIETSSSNGCPSGISMDSFGVAGAGEDVGTAGAQGALPTETSFYIATEGQEATAPGAAVAPDDWVREARRQVRRERSLPWVVESWVREAHERALEVVRTPAGQALALAMLGRLPLALEAGPLEEAAR